MLFIKSTALNVVEIHGSLWVKKGSEDEKGRTLCAQLWRQTYAGFCRKIKTQMSVKMRTLKIRTAPEKLVRAHFV